MILIVSIKIILSRVGFIFTNDIVTSTFTAEMKHLPKVWPTIDLFFFSYNFQGLLVSKKRSEFDIVKLFWSNQALQNYPEDTVYAGHFSLSISTK